MAKKDKTKKTKREKVNPLADRGVVKCEVPAVYLDKVTNFVAELEKRDGNAKPIKWPKGLYSEEQVAALVANLESVKGDVKKMSKQYRKLQDLEDMALSVEDSDALNVKLGQFEKLFSLLADMNDYY